jgi:hypothetical protein
MTFRETGGVVGPEISQLESFPSGPKAQPGKVELTVLAGSDSPLAAVDLEEAPSLIEEPIEAPTGPSEDPVRLYLKEIGKVPLLRAEQEVTIGQRIETGQIALRRARVRIRSDCI